MIVIEIRLLKSSITRAFFSASIEAIIFPNIIGNLVLTLEKAYNLAIATFDSFSFFFYICIAISKFNFTIFIDFDLANFIDFDLSISNMSIEDKSRPLFYDAPMSIRLNLNDSSIKYFSKNCAILFDRWLYEVRNVRATTRELYWRKTFVNKRIVKFNVSSNEKSIFLRNLSTRKNYYVVIYKNI